MLWKTHDCGTITREQIGETVVLNGWVQRRRDLGGVLFVDLRDRSGIVQIVFSEAFSQASLDIADRIRNEYVIAIEGHVVLRDPDTVNPALATGHIEVRVTTIHVLNPSKNPPFFIEDGLDIEEAVRLKYRYLDLRRPEMQQTLILRAKVAQICRRYFDDLGFIEVETPILTKSTPEGARDYLVPSRVQPGHFFALPQSPQLFKQLLMVAGLERYYQIARCFRDEDLRADRQPEFTQIDIETSFVSKEKLLHWVEQLIISLFGTCAGVTVQAPFQRLTYAEAMGTYGSDKPDLRFGLPLIDVTDLMQGAQIQVFQNVLRHGGMVKALRAPGCATWSRKEFDDLIAFAGRHGGKGLAYLVIQEDGWKGPLVKFFTAEQQQALATRMDAKVGDVILLSADQPAVVHNVLGHVRLHLGKRLQLIDEQAYAFAWVVDFPMFSWDTETKRWVSEHHPFTRPLEEDVSSLKSDPAKVRAQAYDLVLNGYEIGGGSMRIYERPLQETVFELLGMSAAHAHEQFGFLLDAFDYGTPPHGGIALGFDRLVMLLAKRTHLRDTIAFPKTASASDLLCGSPAPVEPKQLQALSVQLTAQTPADGLTPTVATSKEG